MSRRGACGRPRAFNVVPAGDGPLLGDVRPSAGDRRVVMDTKETLSQGYDRSAAVYDLTAGPNFLRSLWGLLPRVRLGPGPSILDVGCGTGIGLIEAARALAPCGTLHGIDIAPNMLEEAWRKIETL